MRYGIRRFHQRFLFAQIGAAALAAMYLAGQAPSAYAAACTNLYASGVSAPVGHAVAWNPLTAARELLVQGSTCKCGCRDSNCTTSYWQLQAVRGAPADTAGGGSTGGGGNYVGKGPQCAGATPPPQAAAQGITKLEFCDDFSNPSSFDWKGTGNPGFNWYRSYLYNFSQDTKATNEEPESSFTMRDGIFEVHIARNHYSTQLQSAILKDKKPVGYYIDRKAGGWYVEAAIAHPSNINGFGFWSMDMCHMYMWPERCERYAEPDWYEYWVGGETRGTHMWFLVGNKQTKDKSTDCNNWFRNGLNPNEFHGYGALTTSAGVTYWRNNAKVAACDKMPWKSEVVAGPPSEGTKVGRYPIYIGAQKGMSFKLDFVRVWVKP